MRKVNSNTVVEESFVSPKGKFGDDSRNISIALGRDPDSHDLNRRHPFDVSIDRVPPGKAMCPYHSHSAQWEFYHVISGRGKARDAEGLHEIEPGDAFIFKPGEAHQISNDGSEDLVFMVVADNPHGESCHYPDSGKWLVRFPERNLVRGGGLDYFDGEE